MSTDRRKGLALALGVSLGSLCWGALTAAGLSAVLVTYASALTVIKILGGIYLLWLAFKSFKAAAAPHSPQAASLSDEAMSAGGYFRRGLLIQMSNPKAALAWVAIISLGLPEGAPYWVAIAIVSGTSVLSLAIHSAYTLIFSTPVMVGTYTRAPFHPEPSRCVLPIRRRKNAHVAWLERRAGIRGRGSPLGGVG